MNCLPICSAGVKYAVSEIASTDFTKEIEAMIEKKFASHTSNMIEMFDIKMMGYLAPLNTGNTSNL